MRVFRTDGTPAYIYLSADPAGQNPTLKPAVTVAFGIG